MSEYQGIKIDLERDKLLSIEGSELLDKYYSDGKEGIQRALARPANAFSYGDKQLAQDIYDAVSQQHCFYSSPVLSNAPEGYWDPNVDYTSKEFWAPENGEMRRAAWIGEKPKAMPISCFLTYLGDTIKGQIAANAEVAYLSVAGGGTSLHSRIRAVTEKAPGPIPYYKTIDGLMGYYRQGKTRRGSCAIYMDCDHPDMVEFINMRKPAGGDPARKIDNRKGVHHGVNIKSAFIDAVDADALWDLKCPHTGEVRDTVRARDLWEAMLYAREETGEPYLYFIDVANEALPEAQKKLGLRNNGSNLCSEITLATNDERSAVCALSSLNLEHFHVWKKTGLAGKMIRFIDNIIQWYIDWAPSELHRTAYSAMRERAIGLGAMGWHYFLQSQGIAYESGGFNSAAQWNNIIFKHIKEEAVAESEKLALERGEAPDMVGTGRRNSHLLALAPNANSSVLCNTSSAMEPVASNAFTQKSRAGIFLFKNKWLERDLEKLGHNTDEVWKSIESNNGSVQHLEFLDDELKKVYKTAWEIDQMWTIEHAEQRQPYICQAQSLNVFFLPGTDRAYINQVHLKAARGRKIKSMYYFRTGSAQAADTVKTIERKAIPDSKDDGDSGECLSCQA